jgi:DNA polymerase III subunit epsilon
MLICAYDSETTGLVAPIRLVQLAALLLDSTDGRELAHFSFIVKPEGFIIPEAAAKVHGVTTEVALRVGVPLVVAISALTHLWSVADVRVAHNAEYDDRVINGEIDRLGRTSTVRRPPGLCTKKLSEPILRLPPTEKMVAAGFGHKHKPPNLAECVDHLFNEKMIDAHTALADTRYCGRVLLELLNRGHVTEALLINGSRF